MAIMILTIKNENNALTGILTGQFSKDMKPLIENADKNIVPVWNI